MSVVINEFEVVPAEEQAQPAVPVPAAAAQPARAEEEDVERHLRRLAERRERLRAT